MRQFVVLGLLGLVAFAQANYHGCYREAPVKNNCRYGQVKDSNGCRLDRCYPSCKTEKYCGFGTVSRRVNGQCVCEDSGTACPANECGFRPAESLLLNPVCDKYLVDQDTGCYTCDCDCREHGGECRDLNCPHGQLHRDDGCRLCECRECGDLDCDVDCEFGYEKDAYGCDTCTCKPNPRCPTKTCDYGFKKDSNGRSTCDCACGPVCRRHCPYGFVLDGNDCPICECACPPMDSCDHDCEFGYVKNGPCDTCACKPNPDCPTLECEFGFKKHHSGHSLCECKPNPQCPNLYCEFGFEKHSDGYSVCECKPNPQCPNLQCPFGYRTDSNGNSLCHCLPNPDCPSKSCSRGFVRDDDGVPTCECKCGPVCLRHCPYGNILDGEGCPTCSCKPPPCPVCRHNCKYGYVPGNNDCNSCDCKPAPVHDGSCPANRFASRGDRCQDDGDCDDDEKCCSRGNSFPQCMPAIFDIPHAGKCPRFILLDLTPVTGSQCYADYECEHREKCCNVGGIKRCVTTGATGLSTGAGAGHRLTGARAGGHGSGRGGSHNSGGNHGHRGGNSY